MKRHDEIGREDACFKPDSTPHVAKYVALFQWLIIIVGASLACAQFFSGRTLRLDEASLALNFINKSPYELLTQAGNLANNQSAPVGFLLIQKFFITWIPSDYGIRIFPLSCFIASLFLFRKIVNFFVKDSYASLFALALISFNSPMIFYASECKQYMGDVSACLIIFALLIHEFKSEHRKNVALALAGAVLIFFSNAVLIALAVSGMVLFFKQVSVSRKASSFVPLIALGAVWGASFLLYYFLFVHGMPMKDFMVNYWSKMQPSFLPIWPPLESVKFLLYHGFMFVRFIFGFWGAGALAVALMLAGMVGCVKRRDWFLLSMTIAPLLIHLILSALRLYPFADRFCLYALAGVFLLCGRGLECVNSLFKGNRKMLAVSAAMSVLAALALLLQDFPIEWNNLKPVLRFVEKEIQPGDVVFFTDYNASAPAAFYIELDHDSFFPSNKLVYPTTADLDKIESHVSNLVGESRVWVVTCPASPGWRAHYSSKIIKDEEYCKEIRDICDAYGVLQTELRATGSAAFLYDFSSN